MPSKTPWRVAFALHLLLVVTIAVSAYLHGLPSITSIFRRADLVGHALLIGLLGGLLDGALGFRPLLSRRAASLRLGPLLVLVVAGAEELAQTLSPLRTASLSDFAADVLGVLFFSFLAHRVEAWRRRRLAMKRPS